MGSPNSGPEQPKSSDGSETVDVPLHAYGEDLQGVFVWFEYGDWSKIGGNYYWYGLGWLCDWVWIPNTPSTCFSAGTHLLTPNGSKPIEQFVPGDKILASQRDNLETAPTAHSIKKVIESRAKLLDIVVAGELIHTTREHPVYVQSKGWVPASSLVVGDLLRSHTDRWVKVTSIAEGAESKVFNVIIDGKSAFYVGREDWGFSMCASDACSNSSPPTNRLLLKPSEGHLALGELK